MNMTVNDLITILGPTATGKTKLAAALAYEIGAEIISADSRQVYRGMDLGTGKDIEDFIVNSNSIPYHLIDIADPGDEYNLYSFQRDFINAYDDIRGRSKKAILCGGTGMYLESVILAYDMKEAPINEGLRVELEQLSLEDLRERLSSLIDVHNITDTEDRARLIRSIEIAESRYQSSDIRSRLEGIDHHVFGISLGREEIRRRITARLKDRLNGGMLEEIRRLLDSGVKPEQLEFYGLEYKYLTQHVVGEITYNDMFQRLNSAIHQFAKRQMTWYRRMEKKGVRVVWIDGNMPMVEKIEEIRRTL